jgi:hypothetical protein
MFEFLSESRRKKLVTAKLPYSYTDLEPVLSKETLNYHYDSLAKGYAKKYNDNEGDDDFNYAGYFLHDIYFSQFQNQMAPYLI